MQAMELVQIIRPPFKEWQCQVARLFPLWRFQKIKVGANYPITLIMTGLDPVIFVRTQEDGRVKFVGLFREASIFKATLQGVTTEDIMKLTGWARSAASSTVATDMEPS